MKTQKWADVKARMAPERRAKIAERVDAEVRAINLRRLRDALGATQVEVADMFDVPQSEVSRLENAADLRLSTLRRLVEKLGGELEIVAVVKGKRIPLHGV